MYKELIICIVIIITIFGLNHITQKHTDETIQTMKYHLEDVRSELVKEDPNYETSLKKANQALEQWEELDDVLAFYIEHDEIEKTKTALTSMRSFIEMEDASQSVDAIDRCVYILEHIDQRERVTWDNIF